MPVAVEGVVNLSDAPSSCRRSNEGNDAPFNREIIGTPDPALDMPATTCLQVPQPFGRWGTDGTSWFAKFPPDRWTSVRGLRSRQQRPNRRLSNGFSTRCRERSDTGMPI